MRQLTRNELAALNESVNDLCPELFGSNDYKVEIEQTNSKLIISITEKDWAKEFEDYLKQLDDDIFVEACALYTKGTGQEISKIKQITPAIIRTFKQFVMKAAHMKIEAIKDKYLG